MLSGLEMARLLKQFEEECLLDYDIENPDNFLHHEQGLASQKPSRYRLTVFAIPSDEWVIPSWMISLIW